MDADENSAVRRLLDKDEIIDLVHRYSYYVDHQLYDDVVGLFTDDCVVDYGPGTPPARGRAALRKTLGHPKSGFAATSHHNANVLVTFETDDRGAVRASVYAWHEMVDGATPQLWGYYRDVVVRSSDGWRIATRQLQVLGVAGWADWAIEWHWATHPPSP